MSFVRVTASPAGTTKARCDTGRTQPIHSSLRSWPSHSDLPMVELLARISENGIGQVEDYLDLFPNARYFIIGYGTNDLGIWPDTEQTSRRIIENWMRMVQAVAERGKKVILFDVPYVNEAMFAPFIAQEAP